MPKLKVIFFWDYDTQWGADRSLSGKKKWGSLEFPNTDELLELHSKYNIPSCFAVVGAAAGKGEGIYHNPKQIKAIHNAGHEIASHSHKHEFLPSLSQEALTETLKNSKDSIEQCIGENIVSFVPPFNQPFDFKNKLAFSMQERSMIKENRVDIPNLCKVLSHVGYSFSRISYRTIFEKISFKLQKQYHLPLSSPEKINNVTCLRVNTSGGFRNEIPRLVSATNKEGYLVYYGHPHSIHSGNTQDIKHLIPLLEEVTTLRKQGLLEVVLPKGLL